MKYKKRILAFIPARGGSKSIPLKNLSLINNKPLLYYTIKNVIAFENEFSDIICSTDNKKIKNYVQKSKVEVIDRPKSLSGDKSSTESAINHCLEYLKKKKRQLPDLIFLFQPTSPFVIPKHIKTILEISKKQNKDFDSILTISKVSHNNHAYNQRHINNEYVDFAFKKQREEKFNKQLKPKFFKFGNLICINTKSFLNSMKIFGNKNLWVEIPEKYSIDIETQEDLNFATYLIKNNSVSIK